jgi:hypothetical protein
MTVRTTLPACLVRHRRAFGDAVTGPILYLDRSKIEPGKLADVERKVPELVKFIEEREPQLLLYAFSIDEQTHRMTVLAVHPDARSVELHMEVGAEAFREFADLIEMETIEVYGEPSDRMLAQLDRKARDLGDAGNVTIGTLNAGFSRLADRPASPAPHDP